MLVTSTSEVAVPSNSDFIFVFLNQNFYDLQISRGQSFVPGQRDGGLNPEFGFTFGTLNMNMDSRLFARKEQEPVPALTKNCGTH